VEVQAVACWSEYYNGKWQPPKTSDIDRPGILGTFLAAGPRMFNRSSLGLFSHEVEDTGALCIRITGQSGTAFFLYQHTQSTLARERRIALLDIAHLESGRGISLTGQTLNLFYTDGFQHFDSTGALVDLSKVRTVLRNQTLTPQLSRVTLGERVEPSLLL